MFKSQYIFIIFIIFIIYKTIFSYLKQKLSKLFLFIWLAVWFFGLFIILEPNLLSRVARIVGIGRGVDVVIYFSIILLFYLIYKISLKLIELDKQITDIVRDSSLKNTTNSSKKIK